MRMRWTYGVCHSLHTNGVGNGLGGRWKEDTAFVCSERAIRNVYTSRYWKRVFEQAMIIV